MRRKPIFGVLISAIILLVAPTISAQQYIQVEKTIQFEIENQIDEILSILERILSTSKNKNVEKERLIDDFETLKQKVELIDFDDELLSAGFILSVLLSLFFALLGTIFGNIFGPILALMVQILTFPAVFLAKIISSLFDESM